MVDQPPERDQLEHLRELLVGPTDERLRQLGKQVEEQDVTADGISRLLPEAVRRSASRDEHLARALRPTLERSFEASVKRDPQGLADIIAPILGPAIRRSITQTIQAMVQSLNTTLEHSLSPRGWRWRIEAWRTGKSFGEVVLLHTLVYRTEQVLLIDRKTGLLMQSVAAAADDDADLVSAMLTAIQDFMHESFDRDGQETSQLSTMRSGDWTIWLEHGPLAYLAVAIRGEPPLSLRDTLQQVTERIHIEHRERLLGFDGDANSLEVLRPDLETCLETEHVQDLQRRENAKQITPGRLLWAIPTALLVAGVVLGAIYWRRVQQHDHIARTLDVPPTATFERQQNAIKMYGEAPSDWIPLARNRLDRLQDINQLDVADLSITDAAWVEFQRLLRRYPGIVVTTAQRSGDRFLVEGLRDPLAIEPAELLRRAGLAPSRVRQHWQPYQCLDPELSFQRIERHLEALPTVRLSLAAGVLVARGKAPAGWIRRLKETADLLSMDTPDFTELVPVDPAWDYFVAKVEAEPGLEILNRKKADNGFLIQGRRDPLAPDPAEFLRASNVPPSLVTCEFESFTSLDPVIVSRRVRQVLDPPQSVEVEITPEGIVKLSGRAERVWRQRVAGLRPVDGTTGFDLSGLTVVEDDALRLRAVRPRQP